MSDKLIINVDASALKESACRRRLFLNVVMGYREATQYSDVEFGSAFHEFIKVMKETNDTACAILATKKRFDVPMKIKQKKQYMTETFLLNTCLHYWTNWLMQDQYETIKLDGKPMVEVKFSYPYYSDDVVEINLCGTIDDISLHKHGTFGLRDYKTTSLYDQSSYLSGYALSPQLMFYRMLISYYARSYPSSIFAEMDRRNVGCFIDAIFLAGKDKPPEYKRSEVFLFKPAQMLEFEQLIHKRVMELVEDIKTYRDVLPPREGMINGACITIYGQCKFFAACLQEENDLTMMMLNRQYIQRKYDPLSFGKEHEQTSK